MSRGEVWWHEPPDERHSRSSSHLICDDLISRAPDVVAMPASRTAHDWLTGQKEADGRADAGPPDS